MGLVLTGFVLAGFVLTGFVRTGFVQTAEAELCQVCQGVTASWLVISVT